MPLKVKIELNLKIPMLPNFIILTEGENQHFNQVAIETLSNEQLQSLGEAWTEALIKLAEKKRYDKQKNTG